MRTWKYTYSVETLRSVYVPKRAHVFLISVQKILSKPRRKHSNASLVRLEGNWLRNSPFFSAVSMEPDLRHQKRPRTWLSHFVPKALDIENIARHLSYEDSHRPQIYVQIRGHNWAGLQEDILLRYWCLCLYCNLTCEVTLPRFALSQDDFATLKKKLLLGRLNFGTALWVVFWSGELQL